MDIIQSFYDKLATQYDKLFSDWQATTQEQALLLEQLFCKNGFDRTAKILDCACGIGTQAIGLAGLGYDVTASDISKEALTQARKRAGQNAGNIRFAYADFCQLEAVFSEPFDIVICMDNALPHMLSSDALACAIRSITNQMAQGGLFVASIRDYDALLTLKPEYSPPYIHKTEKGQRVSFQTWDWEGETYKLVQYIIEDGQSLQISKFDCVYRATRREELTRLLLENGCKEVNWLFPDQTGFYQPIVVAKK